LVVSLLSPVTAVTPPNGPGLTSTMDCHVLALFL
jgi:hypothetical protein